MSKFTGNIIRLPAVTPTQNSASGVYTLDDQFTAQSSGTWPIVRDQYFNYTTLLLTGAVQGTAYPNPVTQPYSFLSDASTNNFVVSPNGDVSARPFNPYLNSYGNYFNGSSYLSAANNAAFNLSNGNFTLECWFYIAGNSASNPSSERSGQLISKFQNSSNYYTLYVLGNSTTTGTALRFEIVIAGSAQTIQYTTSIAQNQWHHVAVVRNGSSTNNVTIYLNGSSVASGTNTATEANTGPLYIGYYGYPSYDNYFNGYISNARFVKGTAVYTAPFIPPTQPLQNITNTSLLTCQANRFIDLGTANSGSGFPITVTGSPAVSQNSPFVSYDTTNGSGYFDGTGDWLETETNSAFQLGTDSFTIEWWYYGVANNNGNYLFRSDNGTFTSGMMLYFDGTNFVAYGSTSSGSWNVWSGSTVVSGANILNRWTHLALVRSGSTFQWYVNGNLATTGNNSSSAVVQTANMFTINKSNQGYVSNFRYIKGTAIYTGAFTPPAAPLTAITNTQFLTLQTRAPATNNGFIDSSPNNFVVTRNGNTTQGSFSPFSPTGWSVLNSATSCLAAGSASDWTFLTNTTALWTIEMWVYPTVSGTAMILVDNNDFNSANVGINCFKNSSNQVQLNICRGVGGSLVVQFTSTGTLNINAWNNIVITYDQSLASQNLKFYLNGASAETANKTANAPSNSAAPGTLTIGRYRTVASDGVVGYLGSLRISNVVRTPSGVPTSAYTNDANTKLLICQYNRFLDGSANNYTLTVTNSPSIQAFSPFAPAQSYIPSQIGGSGYFDGSDSLQVPSNPLFNYSSTDMTVEFWLYLLTIPTEGAILELGTGAVGDLQIVVLSSTGGISFGTSGRAKTWVTVTVNQWYHIAGVKSGSTYYLYVNGTRYTTESGNSTSSSTTVNIGSRNSTTNYLTGYMSNYKISNYARYNTTTIPVPTTPAVSDANTSLLLNFTNGGIVDATGKNNLETVANSGVQTSQAKWSPGSMYFDGTGDYLSFPDSPTIRLGSSDFVFECWARFDDFSSTRHLCFLNGNTSAYAGLRIGVGTDSRVFLLMSQNGSAWAIASGAIGSALSANTWYYIAVQRSSAGVKVFVDGSQIGSTYPLSGAVMSGTVNYIGEITSVSQPMKGYMDDVRLTFYARPITASPTGPFPLG